MAVSFAKAGTDFAKRIGKITTAVREGERETLMRAGMAGKAEHAKPIRSDSGGDNRLSGVGRRGARVGARFDVKPDLVEFKATGPLHFLANPMSPHRIEPKKRGRAGGRRVLVIPGIGPRAFANHPGTRGKDTWNKATRKARAEVSKEIHNRQVNIIRKALG